MFVQRDFKLKYKDTWLGVIWVVIQPLLTASLFTIVFSRWVHLQSEGTPYLLFCFCSLIPWMFVNQAVQKGATKICDERVLISKIAFPRLILIISTVIISLVDSLVLLFLTIVLLKIYAIPLSFTILLLPVFFLFLIAFSIGFSCFLGICVIYYRDFVGLIPYIFQVWMYLSPVIYSSSVIPKKWEFFYQLNPLVGIIDGIRWCCLNNSTFPLQSVSIAACISLSVFFCGVFLFNRFEKFFADVL